MSEQLISNRIDRRRFLKLAAVGGVAVAGGSILFDVAPWLDYDQQAAQSWQTRPAVDDQRAQLRALVACATLAANGHNAQPWKFALREDAIEIYPDYARRLPVVDPHDRALWISLGCALENLLIAARTAGYAPEVTYPGAAEGIHVRLAPDRPQESRLFEAIFQRQNTRSEYDGRQVPNGDLTQLQAVPLEEGVALRFLTNPGEMALAEEYVVQGNLAQYADRAFRDELIAWLRFNKKEALSALDGLYSGCSGNPQVPRWLGGMFVAGTDPQQQAEVDARKLRTSPAAVVVATEADDRDAWVRAGQVYERLALQMTALGIKSAFLNQPIETAALRAQFQSALGLGARLPQLLPQLLLRFGYAAALPRSLRRPVDDVLL